MSTAHLDTFTADHLPPPQQWPELIFEGPELQALAERGVLNCASELLDTALQKGWGERSCVVSDTEHWTYAELAQRSNRVAQVLVHDMGLVPGNRVLLRSPNTPMMAACWLGVVKAGGVAVPTMPLLRARELRVILEKAQISHALCDAALADELHAAQAGSPLREVRWIAGSAAAGQPGQASLESAMEQHGPHFAAVATAATDTAFLAFTSGTTGVPKATMHFHRDVIAACLCWPRHTLRAQADDVFIGSPPLAFTFGLGGLLLFPLHIGASTVLLPQASPPLLIEGVRRHGATVIFTSPTSYRAMAARGQELRSSSLRHCVSAGEALPAATREQWSKATGLGLIDGIGSTELLHIFISARAEEALPGATGREVPGYRARVVDEQGQELPDGTVGRLAVRGPTGCRYLADERQLQYVQAGWNLTGDAYRRDEAGHFHYVSRTDDMIVSSGYNIGAPEVEDALMSHPAVAECGVIGVADEERGQIVKAYVVLREGHLPSDDTIKTLQDHVKATIAPYKYPRAVSFVPALPRTETGKLQRFRLRGTP
ncbi:MAG: benzoate-CoA ligase family protein [Betaproteobacteria bacterium]|nr:benzoate-CoA ligase family protein [Betaproteobacteria bacterium]